MDKFHSTFFYNLLFSQDTKKNRYMIMFWMLLLLVIPTSNVFSDSKLMQSVLAQTESPSTPLTGETIQSLKSDQDKQLPMQKGFSISVLATNLSSPYNILYGPDGALWITERSGKEITQIDPKTGSEINVMQIPNVHQAGYGQDGLMGMAFDPNFKNNHYIYVAYTYDGNAEDEDLDLRTKITRFTYNPDNRTISEPLDIITGLSGSRDHNSGRIIFGSDDKLYYTIGDQGKNQFANYCMDIEAQDLPSQEQVIDKNWDTYEGKVLRMNPNGSIPNDNPIINDVRSHIFTYGHRNPQGIAVGPNGELYVSEHQDKSDDELNHIQFGGNYGWPYVSGYIDDKAYQYLNWSAAGNCEKLNFNNVAAPPPTVPVLNEKTFQAKNFVPPIATFYTVENDYNFTDPACSEMFYICWPTIAPSSLRLYTSDAIPDWQNTFLMPTLKSGKIIHLTLNEDGTALAKEPEELFRSENRYRDLAFSPDGRTIYIITDTAGPAQAINGGITHDLWNPGSVLVFQYEGDGLGK